MKTRGSLTALMFAAMSALPVSAQIADTPDALMALQELGQELSREMVGGTMKLYGQMLASEDDAGLDVVSDAAYGSDRRHLLDLRVAEGATGQPVVLLVHGGGFVRGDKGDIVNMARWFARHGVVAVTMNYRLAPDARWPAGAEDVASALGWIADHAAAHGGDPSKVVVIGDSAGAMHVADYVFREELQAEEDGVIGAVLISPPVVDLRARALDPERDLLYYGAEGDRAAQSVVEAVAGREIPVLVAYAQNEPAVISDQTRRLIEALAERDGRLPLIASAPGHNHISIVSHFGTADDSFGRDLLGFVALRALLAGQDG
ncbi:alpha/beta hydrolase [Salipiger mangrovisoli]|uniref:Alpha/beta hydrolase n=1 Tax=Salipiger mangrovisoli TaxID=2865933 RepID=A0ABR9X0T9_9RHOB|nr:alpha/beta hydrolase [Salipiger mangrovisoli]MBE9637183.1 alpha/beta hydrolase [Salipiger mangrovisoli]